MIHLKVEPYCHNCPNFEAKVDVTDSVLYSDFRGYMRSIDTEITCTKKDACACIYKRLRKEFNDAKD